MKWRLPLSPAQKQALPDGVDLNRLYEEEETLWCYFVVGAPIMPTQTIKSVKKLVNGTPGLMHSLSFEGDCYLARL